MAGKITISANRRTNKLCVMLYMDVRSSATQTNLVQFHIFNAEHEQRLVFPSQLLRSLLVRYEVQAIHWCYRQSDPTKVNVNRWKSPILFIYFFFSAEENDHEFMNIKTMAKHNYICCYSLWNWTTRTIIRIRHFQRG